MSRLNQVLNMRNGQRTPPVTKNKAGGNAYAVGDEAYLVRMLTTGMTGDTFYAEEKDIAKNLIGLARQWAESDPKFLAQSILYAREKGFMKTAPILGMVILSASESNDAKAYFRSIFGSIVRNGDNLEEFSQILRRARLDGTKLRGNGQMTMKAVRQWLVGMSEYQTIKYRMERTTNGLRLADTIRLNHAKTLGHASNDSLLRYVLGKTDMPDRDVFPQVSSYEDFKVAASGVVSGEVDVQVALDLLNRAKLNWELVPAYLPKNVKAWRTMLAGDQIPYTAMLRNLRNMAQYGVFDEAEMLILVRRKLCNPANARGAFIQPFRILAAKKALSEDESIGRNVRAALDLILEDAVEVIWGNYDLDDLGSTYVSCDISGSMERAISSHSSLRCDHCAGMTTALIVKNAPSCDVSIFGSNARWISVNRDARFMQIARAFYSQNESTSLSAAIELPLTKPQIPGEPKRYDTLIFISDNESWVNEFGRNASRSLELVRQYRRKHQNAKFIFVDLMPYEHTSVPLTDPGVFFVSGWSDNFLPAIKNIARTGNSLIEHIRAIPV